MSAAAGAVYDLDWRCVQMHDHIAKGGFFPNGRFPALPEVVASRLRYDLEVCGAP